MSAMEKLLEFCAALDQQKASYELSVARPEAVMVSLAVPGQRWEIEFFSDERVEIERFVSQGVEENANGLADALRCLEG
jgi:hypothetical protein